MDLKIEGKYFSRSAFGVFEFENFIQRKQYANFFTYNSIYLLMFLMYL